jgi:hypothetical protein
MTITRLHQKLTLGTCWACSEMLKVSRTLRSGYSHAAIQRPGMVLSSVLYVCTAAM